MRKSARILCDPSLRAPRLTFTAHPVKFPDSLEMFTLSPPSLNLDDERPEMQSKPWEYKITVQNVSDQKFSIALVSEPIGNGIEIKMPRGKIKPGKKKTIKLKIDPSIADKKLSKSFTIEASDTNKTRYTFAIRKKTRWSQAPSSSR